MAWEKVKLGDVSTCIQPGPFGSQLHNSDYSESGTPIIMPKDMIDGKINHSNLVFVGEEHTKRLCRHQVHSGNLMVARKGDVRKCVFITENEEGWMTGSDCLKVALKEDVCHPKFIYYQLRSPFIGRWLEKISIGATMPSINTGLLSSIELMLPPLKTQKRIADILSAYDDLIENNQKQIKLLEEASQRLYKQWFIDLKFPGHETIKIVDGLPEGWKKEKLVDFADVIMGQSPKSEFYNQEKKGLPFHQGVGSYGTRFVIDDTYSTSITRIAEPGSILFSVRAPVGRLNFTKNKIIIGRGLAAINHKEKYQSFLFYMLKERFFKDDILGNGAIFASISKDELLCQQFVIPNDELLRKYNTIASRMDGKIAAADAQIQLLTQSRDRLLPKLMNNEIEVS
ncbi:restriction endonuclease subunit S [Fibrobacter sp. UWB13]|uniref:restriction endonuclease subunit S n=1 Tax=Fibrobacter sp. UWB13 TaxID=1896204 RepID=UPI000A0D93F1|nr:restriction endonuclease subunit S [Fibrobacter sp. UWB13]SMG34609.1 type I restriction enzyme, S subunit [Fibrobacter sp. UWB13]